jgi:hypothetical protein
VLQSLNSQKAGASYRLSTRQLSNTARDLLIEFGNLSVGPGCAGKDNLGCGADESLQKAETCATGGRGSGGVTDPLESQGSLTLSQDRSLLFAVNAGAEKSNVLRLTLCQYSSFHGVDDLKDAQGHNRIMYNFDSLGGGADDQYGHGTHVAGIIGEAVKIPSALVVT